MSNAIKKIQIHTSSFFQKILKSKFLLLIKLIPSFLKFQELSNGTKIFHLSITYFLQFYFLWIFKKTINLGAEIINFRQKLSSLGSRINSCTNVSNNIILGLFFFSRSSSVPRFFRLFLEKKKKYREKIFFSREIFLENF